MKQAALIGGMALAALGAAAERAVADGLPVKAPPPPVTAGWNGLYLGAHVGLGGGHSDWQADATGAIAAPFSGSLDLFEGFKPFHGTGGYFSGFQGGYNWMLTPRWLVGIEADVSFPSTISGTSSLSSPAIGQARFTDTVQMFGTARARLGVITGNNWLVYATAGLAWSYDELRRIQDVGTPVGGTALPGDVESLFKWRLGWAAGAGVEVPVAHGWTAKFEYQYAGFPQHAATFAAGAQGFESDLSVHSLRAGLNRKIDLGSTEGLTPSSTGLDADWGSIHGQWTYLHQFVPSFRSPYRGQNSFIPNQGRETADVTIYAGFRLWSGAELWINPEIDQGFGLSGTLGVAGFTSGEAYKVGMSAPYTRMQRYFIRQTIDLGGDKEKVEADVNQFGGTQSSNRVVVTIGKLAVPDIFDTNKYAHDPRKDFMNWTLVDTGSFDYAADAWGYTYGAAAEWYQGPWTVRAGIFDLSIVPNSTELDPSFRQFQIVGEIERRYDLWGQPGKVAVTGFLNRGRMGSFADAVLQANLLGEPADTATVRRYRSRSGFAFNLEQQIVENVGFFARAGLAGGNVEPYEFTDVDATFAAGLSFSGKIWGRSEDTLGIAGVVNEISDAHKAYLNAGGLGILVGDGRLPNPGSEQIMEMYYSFPVLGLKMSLDYQFVVNPGYNRDRGPASVFGTRLRAQF